MDILERELGKTLTARQVAEYFDVDVRTVRQYYHVLGGIRLGRRIVFFEMSLIYAIQARTQVGRPGEEASETQGEDIQHREGGNEMGSRTKKDALKRLAERDEHGLLD